jgi:uncharacterized protein (DUF433 family)
VTSRPAARTHRERQKASGATRIDNWLERARGRQVDRASLYMLVDLVGKRIEPPFNGILREGAQIMAPSILGWSQCPAVESIPGKVSGAWVFRDTRLPVATVIENLEDLSVEEVMEQFDVAREQITAVLEFVAQSLKSSTPAQAPEPVDAQTL